VLTGVGVDVSKFFGVRAGVLKHGAEAESETEKCDSTHLWCAWTGICTFWIRTPPSSNRIRSEIFIPVAGPGLDFVFTEKTLLVVCWTYIYPDSNRSRIACV